MHFIPTMTMERANEEMIMTMDQVDTLECKNKSTNDEEGPISLLPAELLEIIFEKVYYDVNACDGHLSMYDALDSIKQKLPETSKNIRLTCKTFNDVNDAIGKRNSSRDDLKKFYKILLVKKLLWCYVGRRRRAEFLKGDNSVISELISSYSPSSSSIDEYSPYYSSSSGEERLGREIALVLFYGANANSMSKFGNSAIQDVLSKDNISTDLKKKLIMLLLAHGANINIQNTDGKTPLSSAVINLEDGKSDVEIIKLLLDHGADVNIQDYKGHTALYLAIIFYQLLPTRNFLDTIKLLLDHGADRTIKDKKGETAIDIVERDKLTELKKLGLAKSSNCILM